MLCCIVLCHVIETAYDCILHVSIQERLRLHRAAQIAKLEVTLVSLRQRLTVLENLKAVGSADSGATDVQIEGDEGDLLEESSEEAAITRAATAMVATVGYANENIDLDSTHILESADMEYPQIRDHNQYNNSMKCNSKTRSVEEHLSAGGKDDAEQRLHQSMDVCDNNEGNIELELERTASPLKHLNEIEENILLEVTDLKEYNESLSKSDAHHTQESIAGMCHGVVDVPHSNDHINQSICDSAMTGEGEGEGAVVCELPDPRIIEIAVKEREVKVVAIKGALAADIGLHFDNSDSMLKAAAAATNECAATATEAESAALEVQQREEQGRERVEEVEVIVQEQEQEHVQEVHIPVEVIGPLQGNIIDPALAPVVRNNWHRMALLRRAIRAFETLLRDPEPHPDADADAEGEAVPEPLRAISFDPIDLLHFFALHFTVLLLTLILGFWLLLCRVLPVVVVHLLCITEYLHKLSYDIVEWNDKTTIHLIRPHTEESVEWWIEYFHAIELTVGFGILVVLVFILGKEPLLLLLFSSFFLFAFLFLFLFLFLIKFLSLLLFLFLFLFLFLIIFLSLLLFLFLFLFLFFFFFYYTSISIFIYLLTAFPSSLSLSILFAFLFFALHNNRIFVRCAPSYPIRVDFLSHVPCNVHVSYTF
jgi:hypothetical protein